MTSYGQCSTPVPPLSSNAVKRVLVFANPIAGRGLGDVIARRVRNGLRAGGFDARMCLRPPAALTADDVPPDLVAVIAIGGDGTARAVAERLYELAEPPAEPPPMLLVPLGTANLMG